MPTVVVACDQLYDKVDLDRIRQVAPGSTVLATPFRITSAQQTRREAQPWADYTDPLTDEQRDAFARADVLLTLYAPAGLHTVAPGLRWVHCVGSGTGHLVPAVGAAPEITLTNSAGAGAVSIAEFVLARILEDLKRLPHHAALQAEHRWQSSPGRTLAGTTVAVVGLGAIGRQVSRVLSALGVRVLGVRRSWTPGMTDPDVAELFGPADLDRALGQCDVAVLAVPGSAENENLLDRARIEALPPGAMVINVGRGTLVDEAALADALRTGRLRSAAIDVARGEPLPASSPLWDVPNLRISPHSASDHAGVYVRAFEMFCENLERFVAGKPLERVVDLRAVYADR